MIRVFLLLIPVFLISSCIQEFEGDFGNGPTRLVVEGSITTEPGPYMVRLGHTHRFELGHTTINDEMVSNAVITISDDEGNNETLQEIQPGVYSTSPDGLGIRGVVGRKYTLSITTSDGTFYQSRPEEILPVADITSVSYKFDNRFGTPFPPAGLGPPPGRINLDPGTDPAVWLNEPLEKPADFVSVPSDLAGHPAYLLGSFELPVTNAGSVRLPGEVVNNLLNVNQVVKLTYQTEDRPGELNFYRWSGRVIFGVPANPELYTLRNIRNNMIHYVNIPKSCCNQCYLSFDLPSVSIGSDRLKDGGVLRGEVGEIPINNFYFGQLFYTEVHQSSLSFEAFKFFHSIDRQRTEAGTIFDKSPELLISNLVNMDNPDDIVLGYFWASEVKVKGQFIPISFDNNTYKFSDDCRTLTSRLMNSSIDKPAFWQN